MTFNPIQDDIVLSLWKFVRGDMTPAEFDYWACRDSNLESRLGNPFWLDMVSVNYSMGDDVKQIRKQLEDYLLAATERSCECIRLGNIAIIDMGNHEETFRSLDEARR